MIRLTLAVEAEASLAGLVLLALGRQELERGGLPANRLLEIAGLGIGRGQGVQGGRQFPLGELTSLSGRVDRLLTVANRAVRAGGENPCLVGESACRSRIGGDRR